MVGFITIKIESTTSCGLKKLLEANLPNIKGNSQLIRLCIHFSLTFSIFIHLDQATTFVCESSRWIHNTNQVLAALLLKKIIESQAFWFHKVVFKKKKLGWHTGKCTIIVTENIILKPSNF